MKDLKDNKTIVAFEKKAMTNAERQKAYRDNSDTRRLDMRISTESSIQLSSLAHYFDESKVEIIQKLLDKAYRDLLDSADFDMERMLHKI